MITRQNSRTMDISQQPLSLKSPETGFMLAAWENRIKQTLLRAGYSIMPKVSATSKELCVSRQHSIACYLSRKVGLSRGELQIIVHPETAKKLATWVQKNNGMRIHKSKQGRYITSSNYGLFNTKGYDPELTSNEHAGAAYCITVTNDLIYLQRFAEVLFSYL